MDLQKVERVYTSYAGVYDKIFGKVFHEGRESAIRNLNVQPNERVLEVGVGTGLALPMYPRHCQIVAIDFSEGMLDIAKKRAVEHQMGHVTLHRMDAGAMEFADSSFDTVVAAYVVTAVPDYRKVVNEMIRVCRPGGRRDARVARAHRAARHRRADGVGAGAPAQASSRAGPG